MSGRHARPGPADAAHNVAVATLTATIVRFGEWLAYGGPQPALDGATVAAIKELLHEVGDGS